MSGEDKLVKGLTDLIVPRTQVGHVIAEMILLAVGVIAIEILSQWVPNKKLRDMMEIGAFGVGGLVGMVLFGRLLDAVATETRRGQSTAGPADPPPKP